MATATVKTTYSLDQDTVRTLERMAHRLKVSKSEALRRAIQTMARLEPPVDEELVALDRLQHSLGLSAEKARRWETSVREERRASSRG
jgi:hypothetical protein